MADLTSVKNLITRRKTSIITLQENLNVPIENENYFSQRVLTDGVFQARLFKKNAPTGQLKKSAKDVKNLFQGPIHKAIDSFLVGFFEMKTFTLPPIPPNLSFCAEPKAKSQNPYSIKEPSPSGSTSFNFRSPQHRTVNRLECDGDYAQALQKCEELRQLCSLEMYRLTCECLRRKLAQVS